MNKLGVFGTSGFAREVADIAHVLEYDVVFIARDDEELSSWSFPGRVILESEMDQLSGAEFVIGIGENSVREKIAKRYSSTLKFTNLVHPTASFGRNQREQLASCRGVIVCAGVRLTSNIQVGDFTVFNLNATVGHDSIIEGFVNLSPGAHISGNVHLEERCWVGSGAVINQGRSYQKLVIGRDTVIGSGAVVVKDCESDAVYVGAPAKRIK